MGRWTARFVDQPPISGTAEEHSFEIDDAESSAWQCVHFEDAEAGEWFGAFRQGRVSSWRGVASPDERHFFIITGGVLYCVDAEGPSLAGRIPGSSADAVIRIPR